MQASRSFGLLAALIILAGTAVWFLWSGGTAEVAPTTTPTATVDTPTGRAEHATAETPGQPEATTQDRSVAAVQPGATMAAAATRGGFQGVVHDESGQPVAGAKVTCTANPDFRGDTPDELFRSLGGGLDPEALRKRFAELTRNEATTTTDPQGRFAITPDGTAANARLRVRQRGFTLLDRNLPRPADSTQDLGVLVLTRGAIVGGRVVTQNGSPIADASVAPIRSERGGAGDGRPAVFGGRDFGDLQFPGQDLWEQFSGAFVHTDADGRFELPHLAAGAWTLRARHPRHPNARSSELTLVGDQAPVEVTITMAPGATIRGRVVEGPADLTQLQVNAAQRRNDTPQEGNERVDWIRQMGDLAADAGVGVGERSVRVSADGTFELTGLPMASEQRLWLSHRSQGFGMTICSTRVDVDAGANGVELRYDPGVTVSFTVVDHAGAPIERMWVGHRLTGGGGIEDFAGMAQGSRQGQARDYPDGKVLLADLRPKSKQTLTLTIAALGARNFERKAIALPTAGNLDLGTIRLETNPRVLVTVTGPDGKPVAGASVSLREATRSGGGNSMQFDLGNMERMREQFADAAGMGGGSSGPRSARTDADGRCQLNAVIGGNAVLRVRADELAPHTSEPTTLAADADRDWPVQMLTGGSVVVTVMDTNGKPVGKARIEHRGPGVERGSGTASDTGEATFTHLAPGTHRFRVATRGRGEDLLAMATGGGNDQGFESVVVQDGAQATLTLGKAATASVRGIVRQNGAPLADARVSLLPAADPAAADGNRADPTARLTEAMAQFGGGGGSRRGRSGADGSYEIKDATTGTQRLQVTHRDRASPMLLDVVLIAGENAIDVDLDVTAVRGIVRNAAGAPLADATVQIAPADGGSGRGVESMLEEFGGMGRRTEGSVKTGADGAFELRGVPNGRPFKIQASAKDHAGVTSAPLTLAAGITQSGVDLQLLPAGKIKVKASGNQLGAVRATYVGADAAQLGVRPAMQPLRGNNTTLSGLRAGRWKVELVGLNGAGEPKEVDVVAGETVEVSL